MLFADHGAATNRDSRALHRLMISIHPLTGLAEICEGDDLAMLLRDALGRAGLWPLQKGDILVVTLKILS